jgi:hypothetical protein
MAEAVIYRIDTFTQGMFLGRGDVKVWMNNIGRDFATHAKHYAPVDTGELVAGISHYEYTSGAHEVRGAIVSSAPHTMYVLRGTGYPVKGHAGYIYTTKGFITRNEDDAYVTLWGVQPDPKTKFTRYGGNRGKGPREWARRQIKVRKKGYWLHLEGGGPEDWPARYKFKVRGQDPNNFLLKAWRRTASNHTAIRAPKVMLPGQISTP